MAKKKKISKKTNLKERQVLRFVETGLEGIIIEKKK